MEVNEGEEEEEWEEQYVYIDLVGMVDPDKLNLCNKENTSILGVDGNDVTVIKLGGYVFAGSYEESIGTMVFFEENQVEDKKPILNYHCHTTKVLKASRAFLKPKYEEQAAWNDKPGEIPSKGENYVEMEVQNDVK